MGLAITITEEQLMDLRVSLLKMTGDLAMCPFSTAFHPGSSMDAVLVCGIMKLDNSPAVLRDDNKGAFQRKYFGRNTIVYMA